MNEDMTGKVQKIEELEMKVALLQLEKNKLKGENHRIQESASHAHKMTETLSQIKETNNLTPNQPSPNARFYT